MQPLVEFIGQYQDLGWLFVLALILVLRHRKVWVDGPTYQATEERCAKTEEKLESYRIKVEQQAEANAQRIEVLTQILAEDRRAP